MTTSLFEEAIADAKKIREVAEENAKKAILEAVTPRIKEFIESQILEQDETLEADSDEKNLLKGDDEKDVDEKHCMGEDEELVELDESAINALLNLVDGQNLEGESKDAMSLALKEAYSRLTISERDKISNMAQKLNSAVDTKNSTDKINEEKNMSKEQYYEVDLQALREAVEDMQEQELNEEEHEDSDLALDLPDDDDLLGADQGADEADADMLPKDEVERQIKELIADLGLELDDEAEDEEDEAEQLDEVFEIDPRMLRQELSRVKKQIAEAKSKGLAYEKGGISNDMEKFFGGKGSKNAGVAGSFGGGKQQKDVLSEMRRNLRNQKQHNADLQTKLTKYRSAVQTLREQLEELNLFNAKLLYVNKLLQNKNLSESQKRSVVQALDEAQDLREAKVLYKSLTESFSQQSTRSVSRPLTESKEIGGSSRATKSASSTQATGEVDRWARLAGLK